MPEVKAVLTKASLEEVSAAFGEAYPKLFGREATPEERAILLAQAAHETGNWLRMWNYNWGGIKGSFEGQTVLLRTQEGFGPTLRTIRDQFRAYPTLAAGCQDWLSLLGRRFPEALAAARSGDSEAFVMALAKRGYFTGDPVVYARSLAARVRSWLGRAPAPVAAPAPAGTYVTIPGYRRAKDAEVTPEMVAEAKAMLKVLQLGEHRIFAGFAIGCETHSNKPKGCSVYLPIGESAE